MFFVLIAACLYGQADMSQALTFVDGPLCASTTYRREAIQKVTTFFGNFQKTVKNADSEAKKPNPVKLSREQMRS